MKGKGLLLAVVAGFAITLAGAQPARADHRDRERECFRKVDKEQNKLEREIRKHGFYSRQAQRQREKLFRVRNECRGYGYRGRDDRWDRDRRYDREDWRDDRDRRDDRYRWSDFHADGRGRYGYWDHNPDHCNVFDHHHDRYGSDRFGRFRWSGTFWIHIR